MKYINRTMVAFFSGVALSALFMFAHEANRTVPVCKPQPTIEVVPLAVQTLAQQLKEQRRHCENMEAWARSLQAEADAKFDEWDAEESFRIQEEARQDLIKRGLLKE